MPVRDLYLLAYDVVLPAPRARALKAVRGFGLDAQLSVHECSFTAGERREIWHRLAATLDPAADRLLMLRLDPRSPADHLGVARIGAAHEAGAACIVVG
jgi:CRISPR/Cas system-associated endoribonuclease Cas2